MTSKIIFTAAVAGLAILAPAQAQRPDRAEREQQRAERQQRTEQPKQRHARAERPQRQERQQAGADRPHRQERTQAERSQRQERIRLERPQRQERVRLERPRQQERVRMERPQRQQVRMERLQRQERASVQRAQRPDRVRFERPKREQKVRAERVRNEQRVRTQRAERVRTNQVQAEQRAQRVRLDREQRAQTRQIQRERVSQRRLRSAERLARQSIQAQRTERVQSREQQRFGRQAERQAQRSVFQQQRFDRQAERQAQRPAFQQQRFERRFDDKQARIQQRQAYRALKPQYSIGARYNAASVDRDWYDQAAAQRYQTFASSTPDYFYDYDYDDGYLYQVRRGSNVVLTAYPLLGGAFGVGQPLPVGYDSYNVPYGYRSLYYDTPDYSYRYGDGAIYRVEPTTQLVLGVVALLSGQRFSVGQMLPTGFDAYNVPVSYRDQYYDSSDAWYRYDDGYIYEVDPYSRLITGMVPVSYGGAYSVGYPAPAYASYGGYGAYAGYPSYQVPYAYDGLYYDAPGYDYHLAGGGIYQVDPITQLVSALVGLVTMTNFNVGQPLPLGYDTYNVPSQYRAAYYDRPDAWYRYDDGHIYEVDPTTRIVQAAIPLSYEGYLIGQPIPAGYPAYPVPEYYQELYFASPDYDYRYYDGGIYEIDRDSRIVSALAALVTGNDFAVGGMLPAGYDAYNLPYAYRDRYQDGGEYMYRYSDGRIYQVDPQTRLIRAIIDAVV